MRERKPLALILCAGDGTRLLPWTNDRPKCMLKVDDGRTLIERHAAMLAEYGLAVHANPQRRWVPAIRSTLVAQGMKATLLPKDRPIPGSGRALLDLATSDVGRGRVVVVLYGDTWHARQWYHAAGVLATETAGSGLVHVAASPPDASDLAVSGLLRVDARGRVTEVIEGPTRRDAFGGLGLPRPLQNVGMIVFAPAVLALVPAKMRRRKDLDVARDLLAWAARVDRLRIFPPMSGGYRDLGTPERYAAFCVRQHEQRTGASLGPDAAAGACHVVRAERVAIAGNGGACAVASHAAVDWAKAGGKSCIPLDSAPALTAWANDHGYAGCLARQVEQLARGGHLDALILFTASGRSENIIEAARVAYDTMLGPRVVTVTCRQPSPSLVAASDYVVRLPHAAPRTLRDYAAIEDAMSVWAHAVAITMDGLSPWSPVEAERG